VTEAEELEMLELEEEEARSAAAPERASEDPGLLSTIGHKLLQGFWKGGSDELAGKITQATVDADPSGSAHWDDPSAPNGSRALRSSDDVYTAGRDAERRSQNLGEKHHPVASTIAQGLGEMGSDAVAAAFGAPVGSLPYQLATGALSGAGNSEAPTKSGVLLDAGIGGGISGLTYGAGKYVAGPITSAVAQRAKPWLQDFAAGRAVKATGAIQADIKGIPRNRVREMGRQLLDQDVITAGVGPKKVLERAEEGLERVGAAIGGILDQADEVTAQAGGQGAFDWGAVLGRLKSEVYEKLDPVARRAIGAVDGQVKGIIEAAQGGAGYGVANRIKSSIQKSINWGAEPKIVTNAAKQVQGILDDEIEKQLAGRLGGQIADEFKSAKSLYGAMALAEKGGRRGEERLLGNNPFGLTDMISGGSAAAGAATGLPGLVAGPAVAVGSKLVRERGSSVAAVGAKALSESDLLKKLIRESPQDLGRFAPTLEKALNSGDTDFAVADFVLSHQEQEYREKKRALRDQRSQP
jgi:hypothetical protein